MKSLRVFYFLVVPTNSTHFLHCLVTRQRDNIVNKAQALSQLFLIGENMKNKKWLTYTLGIVLTLIVLAAVGGAGFRMGVMQSASFANLTDGSVAKFHSFDNVHGMDGDFSRMDGSNSSRGFDRGRGDDRSGFSPIFGLIRLLVLGALVWFGYKLIKNSGWKLVKVNASEAPASVMETPSETAVDDEKKETE
jgi:hypothetical protein